MTKGWSFRGAQGAKGWSLRGKGLRPPSLRAGGKGLEPPRLCPSEPHPQPMPQQDESVAPSGNIGLTTMTGLDTETKAMLAAIEKEQRSQRGMLSNVLGSMRKMQILHQQKKQV